MLYRAWLGVLVAAGCDVAFGLERGEGDGVDDDGDDVPDSTDLCPHIANESQVDADKDGISVDCDPDDATPSQRVFVPFLAGDIGSLAFTGVVSVEGDAVVVGTLGEPQSLLALDIDTGMVLIDLGFAINATAIEDGTGASWSEIGLFSAHRQSTNEMRGNVCFYGIDNAVVPGYLEFNEDQRYLEALRFPPPISGTSGHLRHLRTPATLSCTLDLDTGQRISDTRPVEVLVATTGKVAIAADRLTARLEYVWIAYQ